jgi:hypothetical protein
VGAAPLKAGQAKINSDKLGTGSKGSQNYGRCKQGQVQPPLDNLTFTLTQLNRFVGLTLSFKIEMCPEL